jgi:hypothetical protein
MDVLAGRLTTFQMWQRDRCLMIELDQDNRAVDAVIEDAVRPRPADPGEPGLVQIFLGSMTGRCTIRCAELSESWLLMALRTTYPNRSVVKRPQ